MLLLSLSWFIPATGFADGAKSLAYDLRVDLPLTLIAGGLWITGEGLQNQLTPAHCRWCDDNRFDARARDALRWENPAPGGTLSDVLVFGVLPVVSVGGLVLARAVDARASAREQHNVDRLPMREAWLDTLFVLEATAVASVLNQIVKYASARERPYAYADQYEGQRRGSFERTSFYSGHTNLAFAFASAAGMVASLRGFRGAPVIWSVGLAVATLVAYARVAGDYHYLSDVLVGAGVGSLVGAGLPWLLHRPRGRARVQLSAGPNQLVLAWRR